MKRDLKSPEDLSALPDGFLLSPREAARVLRVSKSMLDRRRAEGLPPAWIRIGARLVRYRAGTLKHFASEQIGGAAE